MWNEAACRGADIEVFFVDPSDRGALDRAKAVCARCEVRAACLDYAIRQGIADGVWGGLTPSERHALRAGTRRRGAAITLRASRVGAGGDRSGEPLGGPGDLNPLARP